jgi:hypothetical protein
MSSTAPAYQRAATHLAAAQERWFAADRCAARGDRQMAQLERRGARIELAAAQFERDRAALLEERTGGFAPAPAVAQPTVTMFDREPR